MQKILIIERNRELDAFAAASISNNLKEVLDDRFIIEVAYSDELENIQTIDADLILIPIYSILSSVREKIPDQQKILLVTRTFYQHSLAPLYALAPQTSILVVNVTMETTLDTIRLLYEVGVQHLNFVAYDPFTVEASAFAHAVTPGEKSLVPPQVPHIIDTGFRCVDTQTFLSLFTKLNICDETLSENLLRYTKALASKHTDVEERFLSSLFLTRALYEVIDQDLNGIIIANAKLFIFHMNKKAGELLGKMCTQGVHLAECLPQELCHALAAENFSRELFYLHDEPVIIDKHRLAVDSKIEGFFIKLQSATSIHSASSDLSQRLKNSGFYARYTFNTILHRSEKMARCIALARKVAATSHTVLLIGETGTGKELFAQSIHNASGRRTHPFVAINCAALPEHLLESELFGYEKGAFTGSRKDGKIGLFERADHGTIFLDEIGEISLTFQQKLLRVLQERQIVKVGGTTVINVDIRVIAATNSDLTSAMAKGTFRVDLYHRLNAFMISVPPLRKRREDILLLFQAFLGKKRTIPLKIEKTLMAHSWTGNVRELQNVADYYNLMEELPSFFHNTSSDKAVHEAPRTDEKILTIVQNYSPQGIGRGKILQQLAKQGIELGEAAVEASLRRLQHQELIERRIGRGGAAITQKGAYSLTAKE